MFALIEQAEPLHFVMWAVWLFAAGMYPVGYMLGSSCSPCCGGAPEVCCGDATRICTNPETEGTWSPSGAWSTGITWSFAANTTGSGGEQWFFFGSAATSKAGGGASLAEQTDWDNLCNWFSNKTNSPETLFSLAGTLNKRSDRLPPSNATVFVYSPVDCGATARTVSRAYFFGNGRLEDGELSTTATAHDSTHGTVIKNTNFEGLSYASGNAPVLNGGCLFLQNGTNGGTVNDGATFLGDSENGGTVNDGAEFLDDSNNGAANLLAGSFGAIALSGIVNGGATFYGTSTNAAFLGTVNDGAEFFGTSTNLGTVNGGAVFNDSSENIASVNGGATFNDTAANGSAGNVNGGASFNDAACSRRVRGGFGPPCTRAFVAHITDTPTCNGTAVNGCTVGSTCGCG